MDLEFTEEQESLREMVRDFANNAVAPISYEYDVKKELPYGILADMAEMGLFGLPLPEEYGGQGGTHIDLCIALEELARVDQSVAITLEAAVGLGAMPIFRSGTEEQKQQWLPDLAAGKALAGFGLTEPEAGSDAGATKTTAVLDNGEMGHQWLQAVHHQLGHPDHEPRHRHRGHRAKGRRQRRTLRHHRAVRHSRLHRWSRL